MVDRPGPESVQTKNRQISATTSTSTALRRPSRVLAAILDHDYTNSTTVRRHNGCQVRYPRPQDWLTLRMSSCPLSILFPSLPLCCTNEAAVTGQHPAHGNRSLQSRSHADCPQLAIGVLSTLFAGIGYATSGGGKKMTGSTPAINAGSRDEERFIRCVRLRGAHFTHSDHLSDSDPSTANFWSRRRPRQSTRLRGRCTCVRVCVWVREDEWGYEPEKKDKSKSSLGPTFCTAPGFVP